MVIKRPRIIYAAFFIGQIFVMLRWNSKPLTNPNLDWLTPSNLKPLTHPNLYTSIQIFVY